MKEKCNVETEIICNFFNTDIPLLEYGNYEDYENVLSCII